MRARFVNESRKFEEMSNDELRQLYQKDPDSKDGIFAKIELKRRADVNGDISEVNEAMDFKRGNDPKDALNVGLSFNRLKDKLLAELAEQDLLYDQYISEMAVFDLGNYVTNMGEIKYVTNARDFWIYYFKKYDIYVMFAGVLTDEFWDGPEDDEANLIWVLEYPINDITQVQPDEIDEYKSIGHFGSAFN